MPAKIKPDPVVVKQVAYEAESRLQDSMSAPEGTFAAPADLIKKFGKLIPGLAKPLLEIAMMGADGQLSPSEITRIAGIVADAVVAAMKPGSAPQP